MLTSCGQGHYIGMTFKYYLPLGLIIVVWSIAFQGVLILHSLYKAGMSNTMYQEHPSQI